MCPRDERRKFERYETEVQIYFHVGYDLETRVEFQVVDEEEKKESPKYSAISKNISCDGLSFVSEVKLDKEDRLDIEVFVPQLKKPVLMQGEVRWSKVFSESAEKYETGVRLLEINGQSVIDSIYFDEEYQVMWSDVLETVLGNFRKVFQKKEKNR